MRYIIMASLLLACGCSVPEDPAKLKAKLAAAEHETARVRAEAEVTRLKANAGLASDKSFLKSPLEGLWVSAATASHTFEFFPDGTFQEEARLTSNDGTYTVLDGSRVKLVVKSVFGDTVTVMTWRIEGDTLHLEGGLYPMKLTRK